MECAQSISLDARSLIAAAEVASGLTDRLGGPPNLVVLFASSEHRDDLPRIRDRILEKTGGSRILGCTVSGAIAGDREHEDGPSLVAFAIRAEGARIETFHSTVQPTGEETAEVDGLPYRELAANPGSAALLFPDPFSYPTDGVVRSANDHCPGSALIGGVASGGARAGDNRLLCDDKIENSGAVGAWIGGTIQLEPIVSQGCRPIGRHFVITRGKENVIEELGGQSALARLEEVVAALPEEERRSFARAVHLGRVTNEYKSEFHRGDFLVRSVIGIDRTRGSVAINDFIRRGQTVQFMLRDPRSATEDLEFLLDRSRDQSEYGAIRGALLFACNGRGSHMFTDPHHDAARVAALTPALPVAGFFAAGEIGPVGGVNFLHGFTASIALFREVTLSQ
jgi:small ligand-binding sensory domain FIST